jgi:hypothetical protein
MFNINDIINRKSGLPKSKIVEKPKNSVFVYPLEKPNMKYRIRHDSADFICYETGEVTKNLQGQLEGIYYNERSAECGNFNITEFWIVLIDETEKHKIIAYGQDGAIAVQDFLNRCCSIQSKEELDIELSFFVRPVSFEFEYINGFVRRTINNKPLEPFKQFKELPKDAAARIEYYKEEIEKLNARIREWS